MCLINQVFLIILYNLCQLFKIEQILEMNGRDTTTLFFLKWNVIVFNLLEIFCITEKL